ncbi:cupin domain [Alkalibaculum bacchi]|uniref:Cupin domain n=1 Tax=Alkalibaculum bacchi TaxID=645887 RepID=A0A366I4D1_9FIRM|nr:cupin domain-containing protein [Alkalibaculum bacchi]RBP62121.1 cupin domain [Alkalibaculum bacchi]
MINTRNRKWCDILGKSSNLLKFKHFAWSGVEKEDFKPSIEGERNQNETTVQHIIENGFGTCFHLNYYECSFDGFTPLEKLQEVHAVIVARGEGKIIVDDDIYIVKPMDIVIIPKGASHQFISTDDEPFGFFCIINKVVS